MSKQMEYAIKGGIIGGLIGLALHLLFKLIFSILGGFFRFWKITIPILIALIVMNHIDYHAKEGPLRNSIMDSFQKDRVTITETIGIAPSYDGAKGIKDIEFTIINAANARIYQISAVCTFSPKALENEDIKTARVRTEEAYARHIAPGETKRIRLRLEPDGYLMNDTPDSFSCEPVFSYERSDLFKGENKRLSLESQMDVSLNHILKPRSQYSDSTFVSVTGTLRNNSQQIVTEALVICEVADLSGFTDYHSKRYRDLTLKPGQVMSLDAQITMVRYKPTTTICRLDRVSA